MIESAVAKLTFAYLAILMCLSIGFSLLLYRVSDVALTNGLRQPHQAVFRETSLYDFEAFRRDRLHEAQLDVRQALIILNVITFASGFAVSYFLARRTLEPIDRALTAQKRFAADASHELRTPLASMQAEIEVSLRDKNLSLKEAKEQLASNLEEVQRMRRLADSLLALARQGGVKSSNKTSRKLKTLILDATDMVEKQADAKSIQINLPSQDVTAKVEPDSLKSILKIYLDNAIKYSPEGSVVTIELYGGKKPRIVVADQGQGIASVDQEHIFERFYRADSSRTTQRVDGHGLGLSIAKKLADDQGWRLVVESVPEKGSRFSVILA